MEADTASGTAARFVRQAREQIAAALAPVATRAPYALVDYPNYANAGDAAIWLGTAKALRELNGRAPAYTATVSGFSARACRAAVGGGTVYMLGGGSFGDLYAKHHTARLAVIASMTENPTVLLPLSIAVRDDDAALNAMTARVCAAHPQLTMLAREEMSRQGLAARFGMKAALCPDLSLMLDAGHTGGAGGGIVAILRQDDERRAAAVPAPEPGITMLDWYTAPAMRRANRRGKLALALTPASRLMDRQNRVAQAKLGVALSLIANADVVVTDRLHAHLLATMRGIPTIVIDNATGKIAAYLDCWTGGLPGVTRAACAKEAIAAARAMMKETA